MMDTKLIEVAVNESESMITNLMSAAERLQRTIENETHLRRMLKEAEQALENAEAEILFEAEIAAKTSTGYWQTLPRRVRRTRPRPPNSWRKSAATVGLSVSWRGKWTVCACALTKRRSSANRQRFNSPRASTPPISRRASCGRWCCKGADDHDSL